MATVQPKTPGVYISEPDSFPPAIVGVETAVPAFIGYTEIASDKGKQLHLTPTRISSFAEYSRKFGRGFQERYYISPADKAPPPADTFVGVVSLFEGGPKFNLVKEGAASFYLYSALQLFYANGGGDCYIVSCGEFFTDQTRTTPSHVKTSDLHAGLDAIANVVGPTMLVVPDAMRLAKDEAGALTIAMLTQCMEQRDRVAILDVWGTDKLQETDDPAPTIADFRTGLAAAPRESLRYGMAYFPYLKTSTVSKNDVQIDYFYAGARTATLVAALRESLTHYYPESPPGKPDARAVTIGGYLDLIGTSLADTAENLKDPPNKRNMTHSELTQALLANLPSVGDLFTHVADSQSILPPSAAMAGVYTMTDATLGVWNAPANVGIATLIAPTVTVNQHQQEDMNSPTEGKAVNAIRNFPSRGPLVWGAHTLDSTSNDWRYIQVRRTMIYVEQSVKTALNSFVFAPNTASTWTTVVSMIESFLHGLWSAGGLMGASPAQAYSVRCGLGSTMTPDDILNGNMIVHVVLQMVHPAEFIELVFNQQMLAAS